MNPRCLTLLLGAMVACLPICAGAQHASSRHDCEDAARLPADADDASRRIACTIPAELRRDVTIAELVGGQLRLHDSAAWLSTDALVAARALDGLRDPAGWVTEQRDDGIHIRYFAGKPGEAMAVAEALLDLQTMRIVSSGRLQPAQPPTERERRLLRARELVLNSGKVGVCTPHAPNIVMLEQESPTEQSIQVFVMSAWMDPKSAPLGGYHAIEVSADGSRILREFSQTHTCLAADLTAPQLDSLMVTHLTSVAPTAFHVFMSLQYRKPVIVMTVENRRLWKVEGTTISLIESTDNPPSP